MKWRNKETLSARALQQHTMKRSRRHERKPPKTTPPQKTVTTKRQTVGNSLPQAKTETQWMLQKTKSRPKTKELPPEGKAQVEKGTGNIIVPEPANRRHPDQTLRKIKAGATARLQTGRKGH